LENSFYTYFSNKRLKILKKIDTKEYQHLVDLFERYKRLHEEYGNIAGTNEEDKALRQSITKLKNSYEYYCMLLSELKDCLQNYQITKEGIKVKMYNQVRKMNNISKDKE
jgi:hypothetical protein